MYTIICEHFYGKVWIDTCISVYQKENDNIRYIDDLFFIWKGTEEYLLKICKRTNGKLCLTIYRKRTDRQNWLHFTIFEERFPYSQALRISNFCTKTNEKTKQLPDLKETFLKCGYQETSIDDQFIHLNTQKQQTKKKEVTQVPLVITYNQTLPDFRKILNDNWNLLEVNKRRKHVFKEQPTLAYRRNKNLRDNDWRHCCQKQQSIQKTEADIKKWLL